MASATQLAWLKTMVTPAQVSQRVWGVPASVTLAQCIVESGWGQNEIARKDRNYFGVKALPGQPYCEFVTEEDYPDGSKLERAKFAVYPSAIESFHAHGRLLATSPRYAAAMAVRDDIAAFCVALQGAGYSTSRDPLTHQLNYAHRLMNDFILRYRLLQYDTTPPSDEPAVGLNTTQEAA